VTARGLREAWGRIEKPPEWDTAFSGTAYLMRDGIEVILVTRADERTFGIGTRRGTIWATGLANWDEARFVAWCREHDLPCQRLEEE